MSTILPLTCTRTTGAELGEPVRDALHSTETRFDLTVGQRYPAAGMGLYRSVLVVLVRDDSGRPAWLPAGLFDLPPSPLPFEWEVGVFDPLGASGAEAAGWTALWGYPQLVRDDDHLDGLAEQDPEAIRAFVDVLDADDGWR